ncbi:uncharacterized protein METZ01_LOCUS113019, partial [marine metagenome]
VFVASFPALTHGCCGSTVNAPQPDRGRASPAPAKMSLVRVHVHYSGRVQGVGFRYTVRSLVPGYDVLGTIRNLPDGRVELVAEGERAELEEFLQAVRDSGLRRNIQDEDIVWEEAQDKFRGFEIAG